MVKDKEIKTNRKELKTQKKIILLRSITVLDRIGENIDKLLEYYGEDRINGAADRLDNRSSLY